MKRFYELLVAVALLSFSVAQSQSLSNYYLESGSNNQEVILHTSFYYHHGAGFIESNVEVVGNTINFSICYGLSSTTVVTNDDREFVINLPNPFPNYNLNVSLYLWDQNTNACDYSTVVDGGPVNFDYPYNPTDLVQVPDDNFEGFFEAMNLGDGQINNLVFRHRIQNISRLNIYGYELDLLGLEQIVDLTGIEHLPRLDYLFGPDNLIQEYDATNNPALEVLILSFNPQLTTIDLSSCPNLWYLDVDYTQLSNLVVSNNPNL